MTDRIRVVRVIARLNVGGPAIHATLLTERLNPARYDSLLVAGSEGRAEGNYLTLTGRSIDRRIVLPTLGPELHPRDVAALAKLVGMMRRVRPQIVHTHTAKAGTLGRLGAWLAKVPIVLHTYHGHVLRGYFSPARTRLFVAIERWLGRRTHCLLAVSDQVRRELLELGIGTPDKFEVIPLGFDLEPFLACERWRGELRRELSITDATPLVGIVARLVPIKAHEVFLRAAALVAGRVAGSRFLVVGDGERRSELERLTRELGLDGRAYFLGWRRDLERVYEDLDVVVLSSRNEGSPVSLIEAMAAARPVVATRVGGVVDLVEDGVSGYLVPSGDAEAMARAITALLGDPDRRRDMGSAGRKRVFPAFSAERLLADMDRLYSRLLAEAAR